MSSPIHQRSGIGLLQRLDLLARREVRQRGDNAPAGWIKSRKTGVYRRCHRLRQLDRLFGRRRLDLKNPKAGLDRRGYMHQVVGGGDPEHVTGIERDARRNVLDRHGRHGLQQAVQRRQGIAAAVGGGLVDLVQEHDGIGAIAQADRVEYQAGFGVAPVPVRTHEGVTGDGRVQTVAVDGSLQCASQLQREVGLAHTRRTGEQDGRQAHRLVQFLRQKDLPLDEVDHCPEVRLLASQGTKPIQRAIGGTQVAHAAKRTALLQLQEKCLVPLAHLLVRRTCSLFEEFDGLVPGVGLDLAEKSLARANQALPLLVVLGLELVTLVGHRKRVRGLSAGGRVGLGGIFG